MKRNAPSVKNVFFIQRAAIDILLMNKATAIEICAYLVICKYTDRYGYESGVGYKTIKERLGVGQKKVSEAIRRLRSMEFEGQKLLYSKTDWIYEKTGDLPVISDDFGWIRGWIDAEYKHQVWLYNSFVGNNGDEKRPLNFFVKGRGRDDHARLLILFFKYQNVGCRGVNHKFASVVFKNEFSKNLGGIEYHKSRKSGWHISNNILDHIGLSISEKEFVSIVDDLIDNDFLHLSVSVLSMSGVATNEIYHDEFVPPIPRSSGKGEMSSAQLSAWKKRLELLKKYAGHRISYQLGKISPKNGGKTFTIQLKRIYTKKPRIRLREYTHKNLISPPGCTSKLEARFMYRLDYKSNNKRRLDVGNCLAGQIEDLVVKSGLEPVSRKGRFYDSYWWSDSQGNDARIAGIIMPVHVPESSAADLNPLAGRTENNIPLKP